jgi:hypothetical protein
MKSISTKHDSSQLVADTAVYLFDDWFDPIEACVRERVREFIGAMIEGELDATLLRPRYERLPKNAASAPAAVGRRHGHREGSLIGTFGRTEIEVPRAAERSRRQNHGVEQLGVAGPTSAARWRPMR